MKTLLMLALLSTVIAGCSSGDAGGDPALDTASPMANTPAPPPGPAKAMPTPPSMGGAPGAPGPTTNPQ